MHDRTDSAVLSKLRQKDIADIMDPEGEVVVWNRIEERKKLEAKEKGLAFGKVHTNAVSMRLLKSPPENPSGKGKQAKIAKKNREKVLSKEEKKKMQKANKTSKSKSVKAKSTEKR